MLPMLEPNLANLTTSRLARRLSFTVLMADDGFHRIAPQSCPLVGFFAHHADCPIPKLVMHLRPEANCIQTAAMMSV